jgi:hypothetical protein
MDYQSWINPDHRRMAKIKFMKQKDLINRLQIKFKPRNNIQTKTEERSNTIDYSSWMPSARNSISINPRLNNHTWNTSTFTPLKTKLISHLKTNNAITKINKVICFLIIRQLEIHLIIEKEVLAMKQPSLRKLIIFSWIMVQELSGANKQTKAKY